MNEPSGSADRPTPLGRDRRRRIVARLGYEGGPSAWLYDLGRVVVESDVELRPLAGWQVRMAPRSSEEPGESATFRCADPPHRSESIWLSGRERNVDLWHAGDVTRMLIGAEDVLVSPGSMRRLGRRGELDVDALEVLLGPALILALAWEHVFCLHASCATLGERTLLFLGESGRGKSTLAGSGASGWSRLADDIVPVYLGSAGLRALPRFAQLKLSPEQQYSAAAAGDVEVSRWFLLDPRGEGSGAGIEATELLGGEALIGLTSHLVAARLFSPRLSEISFRFVERAAASSSGARLRYPWGLEHLPALRAFLA